MKKATTETRLAKLEKSVLSLLLNTVNVCEGCKAHIPNVLKNGKRVLGKCGCK